MLTNEQFDAWVKALRSGEYNQGRKVLRSTDDTFCCLGVLLDTVGTEWVGPTKEKDCIVANYNGKLCFSIAPWSLIEPAAQRQVMMMNDDQGKSFNEIADFLEENRILYADE